MKEIKVITIQQPWATLASYGAKIFDTRSWATPYRGPIAIHAGKKMVCACEEPELWFEICKSIGYPECVAEEWFGEFGEQPMYTALMTSKILYKSQFPLGAIIATGRLTDCCCIQLDTRNLNPYILTNEGKFYPSFQERYFGNWIPGYYAWKLEDIKMLDDPVETPGKQKLWSFTLPEDWRVQE